MSTDSSAPFIPPRPGATPLPRALWRVFDTRYFFRLWLAQVISSTGDWIGLIAIVAITAQVSDNSGAAISLVLAARVVPGFFLATLGGVVVDRFDRRRIMVACDLGRAVLLGVLPFVDSLAGLFLVSFALEILTLLWGPAKDASVPHIVDRKQLTSANALSLIASFGTFPIAAIIFSLLASLAGWLGSFDALSNLKVDRELLALWLDALTFLASAALVVRLPIPRAKRDGRRRLDLASTIRDVREGMGFIVSMPRVRGIMLGLGVGIIGAGAMMPLGPIFARQALGGDSATFGVLYTALGCGAAAGVVALLLVQRRIPREAVFDFAVMGTGILLVIAATMTSLGPAALVVALVGACAGTSYVTGFTVLQETVHDELRGRTFATLYTVIRLCLLLALVVSPLWADLWDWVVGAILDERTIHLGGAEYVVPGVRVAIWGGGVITFAGGWWARRSMIKARHRSGDLDHTDSLDAGAA